MYEWILINSASDFTALEKLGEQYKPTELIQELSTSLTQSVKGVLVEKMYVDKDYRSTYYNFYAMKGARYNRECVRLHFFSEPLDFQGAALGFSVPEAQLQACYLGFMVIRPTNIEYTTIGRTVLHPKALTTKPGRIISSKHVVHILGYKLRANGFPSMNQHTDISVCAHTACWSILRHNSNRYRQYTEFLTHDVTRMANIQDTGGLYPSEGLSVSDAEMVFRNAGLYPLTIARNVANDDEKENFFREVHAYLESGFPLYAHMSSQEHAIVLVGHQSVQDVVAAPGVLYGWDQVRSFVGIDDNYLPYVNVERIAAVDGLDYGIDDIDVVVVPLPHKVFYSANVVHRLAEDLPTSASSSSFQFPEPDDTVVRYFITTSSAFKAFIRGNVSEFDPGLVESIMGMPMAQFVWMIEYASREEWSNEKVSVRVVVDATASLYDTFPMWVMFDSKKVWIFDRNELGAEPEEALLEPAKLPYSKMSTNLMSY
jgi:hypothetical protein